MTHLACLLPDAQLTRTLWCPEGNWKNSSPAKHSEATLHSSTHPQGGQSAESRGWRLVVKVRGSSNPLCCYGDNGGGGVSSMMSLRSNGEQGPGQNSFCPMKLPFQNTPSDIFAHKFVDQTALGSISRTGSRLPKG